jgi:predicted MFS family arabinose efflux permease
MKAASGAEGAPAYAGTEELRFLGPSGGVYPGWKTVIGSTICVTFGPSTMVVFTFGLFFQPLTQTFGWNNSAIAFGATIISIMIMLVTPLQGFLVSRFSPRRMILCSIPCFAAGLASMYFLTPNIWHFYLAWAIIPILAIGVWPVAYMKITGEWFDRRLGLAYGVVNSGIGVGAALLPWLVGQIMAAYGWREAYLGLGFLALLVWPVAFFLVQERAAAFPAAARVEAAAGATLGEALRSQSFWIIIAAFALLGVFSASVLVHQIRILVDAGMSRQAATSLQSVLGIALVGARLGVGWLLDRIKASYVMATFALGAALACALYAGGLGAQLALLCTILFGLAIGAEFDVLTYIIPRYQGRRVFGQVYGIVYSVFQLASAISVYATSVVREHYGSYAPALWALSAAMIVCAGLLLFLGPYQFAPSELGLAKPLPADSPAERAADTA